MPHLMVISEFYERGMGISEQCTVMGMSLEEAMSMP